MKITLVNTISYTFVTIFTDNVIQHNHIIKHFTLIKTNLHFWIWSDSIGGSSLGPGFLLLNTHVIDDKAHCGKDGEEAGEDGTAKGPGQEVGVWVGQPLSIYVCFDAKHGRRYGDESSC